MPPGSSVAWTMPGNSSPRRGAEQERGRYWQTLPVSIEMIRYSERPELWDQLEDLSDQVWPEYNLHGDGLNEYWGRLYEEFPEWQFTLFDTEAEVALAEGHTIPFGWDGTDAGLGPGIDAAIASGFALREAGDTPTALCALAAEIPPENRRRGLSVTLLTAMADLAREAGLPHLVAPIRPSLKEAYPTIPIERYVRWIREDGSAFDPWLRTHLDLGARIGPTLPKSMAITGTVAEWESWTEMAFPETGDYVFPEGLATVRIDHERDRGEYYEPNVWLIHPVASP